MGNMPVTVHEPCPICGWSDWCYFWEAEYRSLPSAKFHACHRTSKVGLGDSFGKGEVVVGRSGESFVYIGSTDKGTGTPFFISLADKEEEQRLYQLKAKGHMEEYKDNVAKKVAVAPVKKVEEVTKKRDHATLDKAYRAMLDMLILEPQHRKKLQQDGWSDDLINKNLIKSLPLDDRTRFERKQTNLVNGKPFDLCRNAWRKDIVARVQEVVGDLEGIPGFFFSNGKWKLAGSAGTLFPCYDAQGFIYSLEIRADREKSKYEPLSSNPEKLTRDGRVRFPHGTSSGSCVSYVFNPERDLGYVGYVTEGKKKAIMMNECLHAPVASLAGVGNYGKLLDVIDERRGMNTIECFKELGMNTVVVVYDADSAVNMAVQKHLNGIIAFLSSQGFKVAVAEWDMALGKGIDDLLVAGFRPNLRYV